MDKQRIVPAHFKGKLTDGFEKWLAFNITCSAADFCDDDIRLRFFSYRINKVFDLVGNMGNNLDRFSQIISFAFLIQDIPVNLSRCQIRKRFRFSSINLS